MKFFYFLILYPIFLNAFIQNKNEFDENNIVINTGNSKQVEHQRVLV